MKLVASVFALIIAGWLVSPECGAQTFVDVSSQFSVIKSGLVLNRATNTFNSVVTITNISGAILNGPLELIVSNISPAGITLSNPTGQSPLGSPFVSVTVPADGLVAGGNITGILLEFTNPSRVAFTFTLSVSTIAIQPQALPEGMIGPLIQSVPPAAAVVGQALSYQVIASSNNPGSLVFSLSTAPHGMTINATTGLLQWTPGSNQAGDQSVTIAARDSAGSTSQSFTLSVFGSIPVTTVEITAATGGVITVTDPGSLINGLTISFPAGALSANTTFTVSALVPPPTLAGTPRFFLAGFSISPDGIPLATPATLKLPYSPSQFATGLGIPLERFLGVYFIQASTGHLQFLTSSVDQVNHILTVMVPHFSALTFTNIADLCPPPVTGSLCGDSYAPSPSTYPATLLTPTVLVHGFQSPLSNGGLGTEATWGDLRTLLGNLDSGLAGRIDAWRFDWDSFGTPFETSAANLATALEWVEGAAQSPVVNIVAHSFGGILSRAYLAALGAGQGPYTNDVNRIMTVGTPHTGIGGNLSTYYANACAAAAQYPTPLFSETCFEAGTGQQALSGGLVGEGNFLRKLNSIPLPGPPAGVGAAAPWFRHIKGQTLNTGLLGGISLHADDGLITIAGATLCGGSPVNVCSGASVDETEVIATSTSDPTGLCHSGFPLLGTTCGNPNIAMVNVQDMSHPLWDAMCTFLGCKPAINVTLATPASGTVTSNVGGINCGSVCTGLFDSGTAVTLTATPATGFTFDGWTGACTGTNPQCIIDILPIDTKPGGYQVGAIFTQALITAQCAGVAPGEIQNGTQLLNASFTFSGTLSGPAPTAVIIASDIGIDCCGLPSIDYSVTPFTCGSWTPYEFPTYFIPGFGYFINSNYGPGYTGGTQCIQLNTPPVSLNWQQTYTIKDVYPEGQNFIFGATIYLFYVGGNEPALAARASASAGCRIPDQ